MTEELPLYQSNLTLNILPMRSVHHSWDFLIDGRGHFFDSRLLGFEIDCGSRNGGFFEGFESGDVVIEICPSV